MIESFEGVTPEVADDAFVHKSAVLIGRVKIGARSTVWPNTTLRGDDGWIRVGDETSIQDNTVIHMIDGRSDATIGNRVTVGHGAVLHGCTIQDETIIGMGAIILDEAEVGSGSIVAAGTVVPPGKKVPPNSVVAGNPFRVLRECSDQDRMFIEYSWKTYVKRCADYRARDSAE